MAYLGTVGDLFIERDLRKSLGEQSDESAEAELDVMLRDARATIDDLEKKLAGIQSKFRSGMSEQSKAALGVMGATLKRSLGRAQDTHLEIQKRRNAVRATQTRIAKSAGFAEAQADLAMLQKCAASVNSGLTKVTPDVRRRLGAALSVAQLRVAEAV
jgi:hypothetical protein